MFTIEELRQNNTGRCDSPPFGARLTATILVIAGIFSATSALASRPPTPENFRVTAQTAYTVTVAWNPPRNNSGNFTYNLSGAYGVTPAVLPKTATSHTFTRLHSSNQYWFFIYAKDGAQGIGTGFDNNQNAF